MAPVSLEVESSVSPSAGTARRNRSACVAEKPRHKLAIVPFAPADPELGHVAAMQGALRRVATLVARRCSPSEVFHVVAAELARLLPADLCVIARYEPDATVTYLASSAAQQVLRLDTQLPLTQDPLAQMVWDTGRSRWISYEEADTRVAPFARTFKMRCAVGTPILVDGRIWGVMLAGWAGPRRRSLEVAERIAEFTELAAAAIANAESRADLVASRARLVAASDDTRRRIERDLHDGAQQGLVTLALKVRALMARPESKGLHPELAGVITGLDQVLDELRELSRGIHPAALSRGGLGPALSSLARRAPLPVEVAVRVPVRPAPAIEVAVYCVVAEALTNVAKHGQASVAKVDVEVRDGKVSVSVSDDGVGGADPQRGSGLVGLRDRVDALGGTLSVRSRHGVGTSLTACIPTMADDVSIDAMTVAS